MGNDEENRKLKVEPINCKYRYFRVAWLTSARIPLRYVIAPCVGTIPVCWFFLYWLFFSCLLQRSLIFLHQSRSNLDSCPVYILYVARLIIIITALSRSITHLSTPNPYRKRFVLQLTN